MKNPTLVEQIKNGGDQKEIAIQLEALLYAKVEAIVEQVRLQEAAVILSEADPKPAVWKNENGLPVIPKPDEWGRYFEALSTSHIQAQLQAARDRWSAAQKKAQDLAAKVQDDKTKATEAKVAAAELKALDQEIKTAERELRAKQSEGKMKARAAQKKRDERTKKVHGAINTAARTVFKDSPLVSHAVHAITNAVMNHLHGEKGGVANTTH